MAAQLCHLLLALQRGEGTRQALPGLRENAEKLAKATEELAAAARRWVCWVGRSREGGKGTGGDPTCCSRSAPRGGGTGGERDGEQNQGEETWDKQGYTLGRDVAKSAKPQTAKFKVTTP